MSIEDDLRDSLRRRAGGADPSPDLDDVRARGDRRDRRTRRLLTAGLVAALVIGPAAGYAIADASGGDGTDTIATGASNQDAKLAAPDGVGAASSAFAGPSGEMRRLFVRTTDDGVTIRAYESAVRSSVCPDSPVAGTDPTDATISPRSITAEVSNDGAVGSVPATVEPAPPGALGPPSDGSFGRAEGSPASIVIVTAGDGVARVRATFDDGHHDEMEPVDGVAVLAANGDAAATPTVEAVDADGNAIQSSASDSSTRPPVAVDPSSGISAYCVAPVTPPVPIPSTASTLPPPGEQPVDPAAARAAIGAAFATVYDGAKSGPEKAAAFEDPGLFDQIGTAFTTGEYAQQVKDATATVTDVVFTSPTTAAVTYDIHVANWQNQFPGRLGKAVLVDGAWKVARETFCNDVGLALITCPPK